VALGPKRRSNCNQRKKICWFSLIGILLFLIITTAQLFAEDFKRALPGRSFSFPQDHFSHPEFKTEWWYYSGHLKSLDQKSYGYQLTFFRTGLRRETKNQKSKWTIQNLYFAHLALTDESKRRFEYREKISRGSLGEAGASPYTPREKTFRVWIENWSLEGSGIGMKDHFLKAGDKDFGIELMLKPEKDTLHTIIPLPA
jgi:predicted secreted hydrolase